MKRIKFLFFVVFIFLFFTAPVTVKGYGNEKIYCDATVDDEFSLDSIVLILTKDETFKFNKYYPGHFSNVCCLNVTDITGYTEEYVENTTDSSRLEKMKTVLKLKISDIEIETENDLIFAKQRILNFVSELSKLNFVYYAGVDYIYDLCDEDIDEIINYDANGLAYDYIGVTEAWSFSTGSNDVKVGVIDTGIYSEHPYLQNKIDQSLSMSFSEIYDNPLIDEHGHGTKVAGLIGASYNESNHMIGICQNVSIVSLKVCDEVNGELKPVTSNIIEAINYATDNEIPILNMSLSLNSSDNDPLLQLAIDNYTGLLVCSAGNTGDDLDYNYKYPACYTNDNILVVGASSTGVKDAKYSTSCYSDNFVDLFAPADHLITTANNGDYTNFLATSAAAPIVSGAAALIKSYRSYFTAQEIKNCIMLTVDVSSFLTNSCVSGGRLNIGRALSECDNYQSHTYSARYMYKNSTHHRVFCPCGFIGDLPHAVLVGTTICVDCHANVGNGFIGISLNNYNYNEQGESYILENGIIMLTEEDLINYYNNHVIF